MNASAAPCPDLQGFGRRPDRTALETLAALAARVVLWPIRVMEARRTLSQLAGLSDYELRDVGLIRQDLANLTARPLDEDPTPYLTSARISRARRGL